MLRIVFTEYPIGRYILPITHEASLGPVPQTTNRHLPAVDLVYA